MNKDNAIYASYVIAEALNDKDMRKRVLHFYGVFGADKAEQAAKELAAQFSFEPPVFEKR